MAYKHMRPFTRNDWYGYAGATHFPSLPGLSMIHGETDPWIYEVDGYCVVADGEGIGVMLFPASGEEELEFDGLNLGFYSKEEAIRTADMAAGICDKFGSDRKVVTAILLALGFKTN